MNKEEAIEYGSKIMSVFPDDIAIKDILFVLEMLLDSTREAMGDYEAAKNRQQVH